ncbi:FecCD family ABC transporter permease [Flexithrix dorotheae]|uniref:FecCD family ABC transporter permease n=1 Tax=Flexithrix dorotheae TaxID=70993 RepID=UPI00036770DB|nr:iron ABC transporter permease [Flexithrix dorotheae]
MELNLKLVKGKYAFSFILLTGILLGLLIISLGIGALEITPLEILKIFANHLGIFETPVDNTMELVIFNIRLPRLIFTMLIGASLGLSGATLQGLFKNPLVEPGIIGISSGAALGAILVIMVLERFFPEILGIARQWFIPVFAFLGGIIATIMTLKISQFEGKTKVTYLILAGVAMTSLASAIIGIAIFYADDAQLRTFTFWTLGDLSVATWDKLAILFPITSLSVIVLIILAKPLNAIALGEAEAFHSGVAVEKVKFVAIVFSALAVSTAVAFSGIIGFVGLVVPHIIRMCFNADHTIVLPASAIGGACLLIFADIFARTLVAPAELPIGVITALIGTPFFIYLLITAKKKRLI